MPNWRTLARSKTEPNTTQYEWVFGSATKNSAIELAEHGLNLMLAKSRLSNLLRPMQPDQAATEEEAPRAVAKRLQRLHQTVIGSRRAMATTFGSSRIPPEKRLRLRRTVASLRGLSLVRRRGFMAKNSDSAKRWDFRPIIATFGSIDLTRAR